MKIRDLILIEDICTHYHVESRFIQALEEHGLIEVQVVEQKKYIPIEKINEFERLRRFHYEMQINMEGLEVVNNLLEKLNKLRDQKQQLANRLKRYE